MLFRVLVLTLVAEINLSTGVLVASPCSEVLSRCSDVIVLEERWFRPGVKCLPVMIFSVVPVCNVSRAVVEVVGLLRKREFAAVCCEARCGRTGTVASIVIALVEGPEAREAIEFFERIRGCGLEDLTQLAFVEIYVGLCRGFGLERVHRLLSGVREPWLLEVRGNTINLAKRDEVVKAEGLLEELGVYDVALELNKLVERLWPFNA